MSNNAFDEKSDLGKITKENGVGRYLHNIFQLPVVDLVEGVIEKGKSIRRDIAFKPIYDAVYVILKNKTIQAFNIDTGDVEPNSNYSKLIKMIPDVTEDMIIEVAVKPEFVETCLKKFNMKKFTMKSLTNHMINNSGYEYLEFRPVIALDKRFENVQKMVDKIYLNNMRIYDVPMNWKYEGFDYTVFTGDEHQLVEFLNEKFYKDLYDTEKQNVLNRRNPIGYIIKEFGKDGIRQVNTDFTLYMINRDYVLGKVHDVNFNVQPDGKVEISVNSTTLDENLQDIKAVVGDIKSLKDKNIKPNDEVIISRATGAPNVVTSVVKTDNPKAKALIPDSVWDPETGKCSIIPTKPTMQKRLEILFQNSYGSDNPIVASMCRIVGRRIKDIRELLYVNFFKKEFARNMGFTYENANWLKGRLIPWNKNFESMIEEGFVSIHPKAVPYIKKVYEGKFGLYCHAMAWIWSRFFYQIVYMVKNKALFDKLAEKYSDDEDTLRVIDMLDKLTYSDFRVNKFDARNKLMKLYFNEPEILASLGLKWEDIDGPKLRQKMKEFGLSDQEVLDCILTTDNEEVGIYIGLRSIEQQSSDYSLDKNQKDFKLTPIGVIGTLGEYVQNEVEKNELTCRITTGDQWTHVQERNFKMMIVASEFLPDSVLIMAKKTYPKAKFVEWRNFYYGKGQKILIDICKRPNAGSPEDYITHEMMVEEEESMDYMAKKADDPYCIDGEYAPDITFDNTKIGLMRRDNFEISQENEFREIDNIFEMISNIDFGSIVSEINGATKRNVEIETDTRNFNNNKKYKKKYKN